MRELRNPFVSLEGYNCFGCSPGNSIGLQMKFVEESEEIVSYWEPKKHFQGYHTVLHGGIQATLMDEIASWFVYVKLKSAGVTSKAEIRYIKPLYVDRGVLTIRASLLQMRRNLADISVKIFDQDNVLCAESLMVYFTVSPEKSKGNLYYPGYENFYGPGEKK
ncbi:MAG: PaaI family thioesterase [Bacteroidetes bacterium]|nr:PaaI family thioesterase [Bacteroidota bacterium]